MREPIESQLVIIKYYDKDSMENMCYESDVRKLESECTELEKQRDELTTLCIELLSEAKELYGYYPNSFRRPADSYFAEKERKLNEIKEQS